MKIEFDSLAELLEFMHFAGYARDSQPVGASNVLCEALAAIPLRASVESEVPDAHLTPGERAKAALTQQAVGTPPARDQDAPAKRKRRTKAEIEADELAAELAAAANTPVMSQASTESKAPTDAQATAATSPLAGANPFDVATSNAPAATAALNEAPAGTTGTLAAIGSEAAANVGPNRTDLDGIGAPDYIALRVAEMGGVFDAREHMKKCVEFIGTLGKARYDEAFELAGTSRSVATYTPTDCAKHIAALEYLQIRG